MWNSSIGLLGGLVIMVILLIPCWQLCVRTGHSGWFSLVIFVPLGFPFLLYVLAFSEWTSPTDWPNSKEAWLAKGRKKNRTTGKRVDV